MEWLNALLSVFWRLIDPAMFTSTVDMVEDVMQASLPGFVDAIKVSFLMHIIKPAHTSSGD